MSNMAGFYVVAYWAAWACYVMYYTRKIIRERSLRTGWSELQDGFRFTPFRSMLLLLTYGIYKAHWRLGAKVIRYLVGVN